MKDLPSIFNDVIGPVMRGPSSSHTAAGWRVAQMAVQMLAEPLVDAKIQFDKDGAWATNYLEQGTAMGINGGLLGLKITDHRMKNTTQLIEERCLSIIYKINSFQTQHVNTVRISLEGIKGNNVQLMAASLGGGLFNIYQVNDFKVDIGGDYFELLILNKSPKPISDDIKMLIPQDAEVIQSSGKNSKLINIKSSTKINSNS